MGLILNHDIGNGNSGDYWRVSRVECICPVSGGDNICTVDIELFKDKATRDAGGSPLYARSYTYEGVDFTNMFDVAGLDPVNQNPYERAYVKLKTEADFIGATDD